MMPVPVPEIAVEEIRRWEEHVGLVPARGEVRPTERAAVLLEQLHLRHEQVRPRAAQGCESVRGLPGSCARHRKRVRRSREHWGPRPPEETAPGESRQ